MKIKYTLLLKVFGIAAKRHAASLISFVESTANEWAVGACLSLKLVIKTAADWQPPDLCNINFLQSKHYLEEDLPVCYELCSPRLILAGCEYAPQSGSKLGNLEIQQLEASLPHFPNVES